MNVPIFFGNIHSMSAFKEGLEDVVATSSSICYIDGEKGILSVGWTAHVLEQHAHNRLIRPRADYTGPQPVMPYIPIDQR